MNLDSRRKALKDALKLDNVTEVSIFKEENVHSLGGNQSDYWTIQWKKNGILHESNFPVEQEVEAHSFYNMIKQSDAKEVKLDPKHTESVPSEFKGEKETLFKWQTDSTTLELGEAIKKAQKEGKTSQEIEALKKKLRQHMTKLFSSDSRRKALKDALRGDNNTDLQKAYAIREEFGEGGVASWLKKQPLSILENIWTSLGYPMNELMSAQDPAIKVYENIPA